MYPDELREQIERDMKLVMTIKMRWLTQRITLIN